MIDRLPKTVSPVDPAAADAALLAALRAGDETAFMDLVRRYNPAMLRLARAYVSSQSVAEEVVQETWLAALTGLDRFEGRSSLKTWLFRILVNRARSRGVREARIVPFSSLGGDDEGEESAVEPSRFVDGPHRWEGHWTAPPQDWRTMPEERMLSEETLARVRAAIEDLPPRQREVIVIRDMTGCSAEECCTILGVSEGNQRVLLHRARSKVRQALEDYMDGDDGP